jgi:hypothetical protein
MGHDRDYIDGLCIIRADLGKVLRGGRIVNRYHLSHPDFPDQEFMVAQRMFTILQEGETPFDDELPPPSIAEIVNEADEMTAPKQVEMRAPVGRGLDREEIADLRAQGFTIDDDNKPVKENVGPTGRPIPTGTWMRPAFCPRKSAGHTNSNGK